MSEFVGYINYSDTKYVLPDQTHELFVEHLMNAISFEKMRNPKYLGDSSEAHAIINKKIQQIPFDDDDAIVIPLQDEHEKKIESIKVYGWGVVLE